MCRVSAAMSVSSVQCHHASASVSRWVVGGVAMVRWEFWVGKVGCGEWKIKIPTLLYLPFGQAQFGFIGDFHHPPGVKVCTKLSPMFPHWRLKVRKKLLLFCFVISNASALEIEGPKKVAFFSLFFSSF